MIRVFRAAKFSDDVEQHKSRVESAGMRVVHDGEIVAGVERPGDLALRAVSIAGLRWREQ